MKLSARHPFGLGAEKLSVKPGHLLTRGCEIPFQPLNSSNGSSEEHFERLAPDRHRPEFAKAISEVVDTALASGTTALLAHSDPEAFAIVQNAQDRGLSVPGDLSVVAYDDEVAGLFSPALTAVRPPRSAVGHAAVDLLAKRIEDPSRPVHRVAISPRATSAR